MPKNLTLVIYAFFSLFSTLLDMQETAQPNLQVEKSLIKAMVLLVIRIKTVKYLMTAVLDVILYFDIMRGL